MLFPLNHILLKYDIQPKGVLHVGASIGHEAKAYHDAGIKNVIWVEALPHIYEQLVENVKDYAGTICINACVTDKDGENVTFNISSNNGESSSIFKFGTHEVIHPDVSFVGEIKLKTSRLDTLLRGIDMSHYDFLNCDLQGAELLAIRGMGDILKGFKAAYLEVNQKETYQGCALVDEVDAYMKEHGFHRAETSVWVGGSWGDALYLHKDKIQELYGN